jgi:hypothetical protein
MMHRNLLAALVLTGAVALLPGCGGSGSEAADPAGIPDVPGSTDEGPGTDTTGEITPPPVAPFPVVGTGQAACFGSSACMACPAADQAFAGQDAQYPGPQPAYRDNGDGTVTDLVTGLMWQRDPGAKQQYAQAVAGADASTLAGHDDWRVPTIKELYSLIRFSGEDPKLEGTDTTGLVPFIDTDFFVFAYGDTSAGQRVIDSQWVTSTVYTAPVFGGMECFFGVNFADGRIKCYPTDGGLLSQAGYYAIQVRGPSGYGVNDFVDNGDGTVADRTTGLTWQQADSGAGMDWPAALASCAALDLAGHQDWRLPNAKELQSLVDYSRSPDKTGSAAIDPLFAASGITNEAGQADWPCYWTSTTHAKTGQDGANAAYVAFGRAMGYMFETWMDVHGAGAQRSDPKTGDPADYPTGNGPQGDAIRILNHVRCVRGGDVVFATGTGAACTAPPTTGPTACKVQVDCAAAGACPSDATKGCTCTAGPQGTGLSCIPACSVDADCPKPPDATLTCGTDGLCAPQGA